jgi:hypothetical protein
VEGETLQVIFGRRKISRKFLAEQKATSQTTINDLGDLMLQTDHIFKRRKNALQIQSMARIGLETSE